MWAIIILFIIMLALISPRCRQQISIHRWSNALKLNKHYANYQQLYQGIDGFSLSRQARATQDALEYIYGEIDFVSFIALLSLARPIPNTVFYDLGSGTGKAVLAIAMVFDVKKSCGIELFSLLHHAALQQQQLLQQRPEYQVKASTIQLIHADYLHTDFSDATLIFINATTLFGETWMALNQQLLQTNVGTIIITTSKKLILPAFILKQRAPLQMSWGMVHAYIQQRVSYDE